MEEEEDNENERILDFSVASDALGKAEEEKVCLPIHAKVFKRSRKYSNLKKDNPKKSKNMKLDGIRSDDRQQMQNLIKKLSTLRSEEKNESLVKVGILFYSCTEIRGYFQKS